MTIALKEIPKTTKIVKAICPHCTRTIHAVGFPDGSKCDGITVICKFCGRVYSITAN